jgi:hypothetical protein
MKKLLDNEAVLFGLERTSYQVSAKLAEKSTGYLSAQVGESQTPYSKNVTEPHMTSNHCKLPAALLFRIVRSRPYSRSGPRIYTSGSGSSSSNLQVSVACAKTDFEKANFMNHLFKPLQSPEGIFWSRNRNWNWFTSQVLHVFYPASTSQLSTVFLVVCLLYFLVFPVCPVFFLFWRGDSSLVLVSFCENL